MRLLAARGAQRDLDEGMRRLVALDLEGAEVRLRAAVEGARRSRSRTLLKRSLRSLYEVLRRRRHYDESVPLLVEIVRLEEADSGPGNLETRRWRNELILLLGRLGRYPEAEAEARLRLAALSRLHGASSKEAGYGLCTLGWLQREQGRLDEAIATYAAALTSFHESCGPMHPDLGHALAGRAAVNMRAGAFAAAEQDLHRARDLWDIAGRPEMVAAVRDLLTDLYVVSERLGDALALSDLRFGHFVRLSPVEARDPERKLWTLERHAFLLRACGRREEAPRFERRAELLRTSLLERRASAEGTAASDDITGPVFECEPFFGWASSSAPRGRGC